MVQCHSRKTAVRTKTTFYDTDNHNLTSIFSNGGLYKKAYGSEENKKQTNKKKPVEQTKKKLTVILIGDCHARKHAGIPQHKLKDQFVVTGFVEPGASLEHLINTVIRGTHKQIKDDHLIFWGGANNIFSTPMYKSLNQIFRYLQKKRHTSVTVINVSQR